MSWIREEDVAETNIIKVISINSGAMDAVSKMAQAVTFGSSALTRVQEEAIAATVSVANKCHY